MSAFTDFVGKDRVWEAISQSIVGMQRKNSLICCPMCVSRGTSADRRYRCKIFQNVDGLGAHCYNCGFKTSFHLSQPLSLNMQSFMTALGVSNETIQRAVMWARTITVANETNTNDTILPTIFRPEHHPVVSLPDGAKSLANWFEAGCEDILFLDAIAYVIGRGNDIAGDLTKFYWTPDSKDHLNKRIIIPAYNQGNIIGWTGRSFCDDILPRYIKTLPNNMLFNSDVLSKPRSIVIVVEGTFDALALDCVGLLAADATPYQIKLLNNIPQKKIILPDRDKSGSRLIDLALKQNWSVAMPYSFKTQWWDADIKDAADAVMRYGRLYSLRSVIDSATDNKLHIEALRSSIVI